MSDSDKQKMKSDLQAKWDVLSAAQKADLTQQMQARMAARHAEGTSQ